MIDTFVKRVAFILTTVLLLSATLPVTTQAQFKLGPRATLDIEDVDAFGIGADIRYDLSGGADIPVQISGGFDYYAVEENIYVYTADFNGHYMIPVEGAVIPYAGAGVGVTSFDLRGGSDLGSTGATFTGVNLVGGVELETGTLLRPFAQGQYTVGEDVDRFGITGGLLLSF